MNRERRKALTEIQESLAELGARLEEIAEEERETFENLPDSIREGDRGQLMEEGLQAIEEAKDTLEEAANQIEGALQ